MKPRLRKLASSLLNRLVTGRLAPLLSSLLSALAQVPTVYGARDRLRIDPSAAVADVLFNTMSGTIEVQADVVIGHRVSILTGTHDYTRFGRDRRLAVPTGGRDVVIGTGAWIASGAIILGPSRIGPHAVVAAGAVVHGDVAPYAVVGGAPARVLGDARRTHQPVGSASRSV